VTPTTIFYLRVLLLSCFIQKIILLSSGYASKSQPDVIVNISPLYRYCSFLVHIHSNWK
jgi:hypothetical protein